MPCRFFAVLYIGYPTAMTVKLKEHLEIHGFILFILLAAIFDLIRWNLFADKANNMCFDWSYNSGAFFVANLLNSFYLFWRETFRQPNIKQMSMCMPRYISWRNRYSFRLMEIPLSTVPLFTRLCRYASRSKLVIKHVQKSKC